MERGAKLLSNISAWDRVKLARDNKRPTSLDYINEIFDSFIELHGDRLYGDDQSIIAGIAKIENSYVTVIGQQKGRTIEDNLKRNYGMPNPEGYRKALRVMKQAEKFNRPIICFIDTPGAFCGIEAEQRGQGEAIAKNLFELSFLKVPILSILIGEGGSGGALALGVANQVWMLENATYSILSPEGFASILWKDSKKASDAAEIMKITAEDIKKLNIIEKVITEVVNSNEAISHKQNLGFQTLNKDNMKNVSEQLKKEIISFIEHYAKMSKRDIVEERYERFRNF